MYKIIKNTVTEFLSQVRENKLIVIPIILLCLYSMHLRKENSNLEKDLEFYKQNSIQLVSVINDLTDTINYERKKNNDFIKKIKSENIDKTTYFYTKLKTYIRLSEYIKYFNSRNNMMIAYYIMYYSDKYNVPINIITSVIYHESRFIPTAISPKKCIGLMQVNYNVWHKELKEKDIIKTKHDLYNIKNNIEAGVYILKYYYDITGSWENALYRYFGISQFGDKVYKKRVITKAQEIKLVIE